MLLLAVILRDVAFMPPATIASKAVQVQLMPSSSSGLGFLGAHLGHENQAFFNGFAYASEKEATKHEKMIQKRYICILSEIFLKWILKFFGFSKS